MQNTNQKAVVKMARIVDVNELAQRQKEARQKLLEGFYNGYQWTYPCADLHSFQGFDLALEYTQQSVKEGKEIYPHNPATNSGYYYGVSFWKSKEEIEAILKQSDLEVEQKLKDEIVEFNSEQVRILQEQLVSAELLKEQKKEEQRIAAIREKALKTAQEHINSQIAGSK